MSNGLDSSQNVKTIIAGQVEMTVDASLGGRILSIRRGGENILLEASAVAGTENANNFGVTFWPSPQSAWGWPPIAAIDSLPYQASTEGDALLLTSGVGELPGNAKITLTKRFTAVSSKHAVDVTYQLHNVGKVAVKLSTWQIARVKSFGLTFFRLGKGGVERDRLETVTRDGVQWYAYDASVVFEQGQKTFADASGWVAHLEGRKLLVSVYPDLAPGEAAEGEAEMELYADPSHTYIEIEPQGPVSTILPGSAGPAWTVRFYLVDVPQSVDVSVYSPSLVKFVEELICG